MVEWNLTAQTKPGVLPRIPDAINATKQLDRIIASSSRPFVLVTERELSVLRRGLTKDGWKRSLYLQPMGKFHGIHVGAGVLSVANRWLETDIVIPEQGGDYNRFFCDCGTQLTVPDDLLPKEEYLCPACSRKYSGPDYDGSVRYIHHNHLAGAVLSLAIVYGIERDKEYAAKAVEILLAYADVYLASADNNTINGIARKPISEAEWVIPLAQAYDLIYYSRCVSDEEKKRIEIFLKTVAERLKSAGINGHQGSWHLSAVGVVGLAIKNTDLVRYAINSFKTQIEEYLGPDGLWPESVQTYHFYVLSAFVHFAEACYRSGIDIYNWEIMHGKSLRTMFLAPLDYMYPCFRLPAINDGWFDAVLPLDLYEIALRRWNDPAFAWVLKKGYRFGEFPINNFQRNGIHRYSRSSFYAFLFGRDLPGRSGMPIIKSWNFDKLGVCTLRTDSEMMITFDYGPMLDHGHLDKLGFTLYANDNVLIPDYGTPALESESLDWYKSTPAHNTIVVDGKDQAEAIDYGLKYRYNGSFIQYVEADASDCYPGVSHTRAILLIRNACIITDQIRSEQEHEYDWMLHCEGEPSIISEYTPVKMNRDNYPLIRLSDTFSVSDECKINWKCENGSLMFSMWGLNEKSLIGIGEGPAETFQRISSVFICKQRGRNARFQAAFIPSRFNENIEMVRQGNLIIVTEGDTVDYVYLGNNESDTSKYAIETDGSIAVVKMIGNETAAVVLAKGSWIKWNGETLIECPAMVDCIEVNFDARNPLVRYSGDNVGMVKIRTNARAMRVNGHRTSATNSDGYALLRVTPRMLISETQSVDAFI